MTAWASVPALGLFHRFELLGTGGALKLRFPGFIGHAVDRLAALVLAHREALGVGLFLHPVRQAVAAEAGQIHQIDVLHVGALTQMLDQAPEYGGLELRSGFVVNRHARQSPRFRCNHIDLRWELSQISPYRRAKQREFGWNPILPTTWEMRRLGVDSSRRTTRNRQ